MVDGRVLRQRARQLHHILPLQACSPGVTKHVGVLQVRLASQNLSLIYQTHPLGALHVEPNHKQAMTHMQIVCATRTTDLQWASACLTERQAPRLCVFPEEAEQPARGGTWPPVSESRLSTLDLVHPD